MDPNSPEAMARALMGEPQEDPYGSMFGSAPQGNVAQSVLDVGGKVGPAFAHGGLYGVAKQAGYDPPGKAVADVLQSPEANAALGTITHIPHFPSDIDEALGVWNKLGENWKSKTPLKWGDPGFPWPQGEAGQRAQAAGFTTPVWHGRYSYWDKGNDDLLKYRNLRDESEFYTAHNPKLSDMYSIWHTQHPDTWTPQQFFKFAEERPNPQLMPLLLRTNRFPVVNAEGKNYSMVNPWAIRNARAQGAPGVTIRNVGDEPAGGHQYLGPQTVSVLLGAKGGRNARSPFAAFKDLNANDLLAGLGGAAVVPALANKDQGSQ